VKATIVNSIIGFFAFGENGNLIDGVLFEKDPEAVADKILKIENAEVVDELNVLLRKLVDCGYDKFVFENQDIARNVRETFSVETEVVTPSGVGELAHKNTLQFAVDSGFVETERQYREWAHDVSVSVTKKRVRKAVEKRDLMIAQAILSTDDLDKTINLFMGRIQEWYGLHFPELTHLLENQETYARLVSNLGRRESLLVEALEKEGLQKNKAEQISNAATTSMGATLRDRDIHQIQELCRATLALSGLRQELENYIDTTLSEVAPNTQALAGSLLSARLIAMAGGLDDLAKMPASTIQVLGAEKALFRALKTGSRPPKHGLLFQHASIHEATRWQRGKVSRALAGKLAIAARIDAYGGKFMGDGLKADFEERVKEIQERYAEPPKAPTPQRQRPRKSAKRRSKRGPRR
jgi:nucleolar protein 56